MDTTKQMIQKGTISSLEGSSDHNGDKTQARILPATAEGVVTRPLTIPWYLRGKMGNLQPGTVIVYAVFEDATGIIISRLDGNWEGFIPGDLEISGKVQVSDLKSSGVSSLNEHKHGGVMLGVDETTKPVG